MHDPTLLTKIQKDLQHCYSTCTCSHLSVATHTLVILKHTPPFDANFK